MSFLLKKACFTLALNIRTMEELHTIIAANIDITIQEGNTALLEIEFPEIFNIVTLNIHFEAFNSSGKSIIKKLNEDWQVAGQTIKTKITETETRGKSGTHRYELQLWNSSVIYSTIEGNVIVKPQRIKALRHG